MSSIHTFPSQVADFMDHASDRKDSAADAAVDSSQSPAGHTDEGMMFPWSIGTTAVAKERPATRRKEECPPETYIG